MLGSLGWFTAFTLQNAAYVKVLGQIELVFTVLASVFFFKEKISAAEGVGILLIVAGILILVLAFLPKGLVGLMEWAWRRLTTRPEPTRGKAHAEG